MRLSMNDPYAAVENYNIKIIFGRERRNIKTEKKILNSINFNSFGKEKHKIKNKIRLFFRFSFSFFLWRAVQLISNIYIVIVITISYCVHTNSNQ